MTEIVERLRSACNGHPHAKIAWPHRILHEAATRIESDAKRIAELEAERINHIDYSVDLQRIIEDVCHSRPVRIPKTTARYHYDLAVGYRQGAITAERRAADHIPQSAAANAALDKSEGAYAAEAAVRQLKEQQG